MNQPLHNAHVVARWQYMADEFYAVGMKLLAAECIRFKQLEGGAS